MQEIMFNCGIKFWKWSFDQEILKVRFWQQSKLVTLRISFTPGDKNRHMWMHSMRYKSISITFKSSGCCISYLQIAQISECILCFRKVRCRRKPVTRWDHSYTARISLLNIFKHMKSADEAWLCLAIWKVEPQFMLSVCLSKSL